MREEGVLAQIAELERLPFLALKDRWRELMGTRTRRATAAGSSAPRVPLSAEAISHGGRPHSRPHGQTVPSG